MVNMLATNLATRGVIVHSFLVEHGGGGNDWGRMRRWACCSVGRWLYFGFHYYDVGLNSGPYGGE